MSGTAVGQDHALAGSDGIAKFLDHFHAYPAAINRNHLKCNVLSITFRRHVTGRRLTEVFTIGTVADNGREALGRYRGNIGRLDL